MNRDKIKFIFVFGSILLWILQCVSTAQAGERTRSAKRTEKAVAHDQNVTVAEDSKIDIRLEATGPNGIVLTYGIVNRPSYGQLS